MSIKNPIDLRQDRRQWLKTSATMVGASLIPMSSEAAQAPAADGKPEPGAHEGAAAKQFFTPAQHELVNELSETIIPADSRSGGAKAAKVVDYIDQALRETTDERKKMIWREGLPLIESMSQH